MTETDSEFEAFLKRRTVLPNGMSDDDKLEPPKALDAIVLKKAREAIRAQQRVNRAPRWATPLALAATILLCLSIVLNVSLNTNRPIAGLRPMTAATADKASPTPATPASTPERPEGADDGTISHGAIPEAKVAQSYAPRSPVLAEAAKPAPDDSLGAARAPATAAREAAASSASGAVTNAPSRSAAGPATPTPSVMASAAPPPPSPAPAMPSGSAGVPADQFTSVTVTGARRSRADARMAASSPSAAAAASRAADSGAAATGLEEAVVTKRKAAAAPHPEDPKIWLQQIAALRAEGKAAQADAEMRRFRAIFPGYPAKSGPSAPSEPPK